MGKIKNILCKTPQLASDTVCFRGHTHSEKYSKDGIEYLREETAFVREPDTLEFIKNYVDENFSKKPKISIVIGACSTGEEVHSLNMLLGDNAKKTDIIGFDLGKKAIEDAKSLKFTIKNPKNQKREKLFGYSAHKDCYLAFPTEKPLTEKQEAYKKAFNEMFEETNIEQPQKGLLAKFCSYILGNSKDSEEYEYKNFKLKDGQSNNCKFLQGDIQKLDKIVPEGQTDVLMFRNALYHLLAVDKMNGFLRLPKEEKESKPIMEKIAQQAYKALDENGILVFGEQESEQMTDWSLVSKVLLKNGFEPIWGKDKDSLNVWKKTSKNT